MCLPGLDLVCVAPDYPICVDTDFFRVLGKAKLILIREEGMTGAKPEKRCPFTQLGTNCQTECAIYLESDNSRREGVCALKVLPLVLQEFCEAVNSPLAVET